MDEQMQDRLKVSALVGGLAFIGFQFAMNFGEDFTWGKLALAFVVFAVVGGIAYGVQLAMNK